MRLVDGMTYSGSITALKVVKVNRCLIFEHFVHIFVYKTPQTHKTTDI